MKYFLILLFTLSICFATKKRKINKLEQELIECKAALLSNGIEDCDTRKELKAATKQLRIREKSNVKELELESKVLQLERENERLRIKNMPKINRQNVKQVIKTDKFKNFINGLTKITFSLMLGGVMGGGVLITKLVEFATKRFFN